MSKTTIPVIVDEKVRKELEKRAKAEMLDLDDLIAEILRRSVLSYKGNSSSSEKLDDQFVGYFSRKSKVRKKYAKGEKKPEPLYISQTE
ncbi:MAG: hypothetical protein WCK90_06410 [archaeon]